MEKDDYFEQAYRERKAKGGIKNMASVFDEYIKMGEEKGAAKKEIEINERVAKDMLKEKMPLETIKRISKLSEAHIRKLAKSIGAAVL